MNYRRLLEQKATQAQNDDNMSSMIQPADLSIGQPSNPPKPPRHQGVDDQQLEDSISLQRGHSIHYLAQFRAGMGHN
jgi:hypothetical protein